MTSPSIETGSELAHLVAERCGHELVARERALEAFCHLFAYAE